MTTDVHGDRVASGSIRSLCLLLMLLTGACASRFCGFSRKMLERSYVPVLAGESRTPVACDHVVFLERRPEDRRFMILGYFVPTTWKFLGAQSEMINAARAAGALHGADAVFLTDPQDLPGGEYQKARFTAALIVWE